MLITIIQRQSSLTTDHMDASFECLTLCDSDDGNFYEFSILTHLKQGQIKQ